MDDDEVINTGLALEPPKSTPSRTAYDILMRQSRVMGVIATRALDATKQLLTRDVRSFQKGPNAILFGTNTTKPVKKTKDFRSLAQRSHELVAAARTVPLPINLFPDSVVVDRTKVTITKRTFFWNSEVITTRIEDILGVTATLGPFFGSLIISTRIMNSTDHYEIDYFWRKDAKYLKQIIQGYVIAQHNKIETRHLAHDELVETLYELGRDEKF